MVQPLFVRGRDKMAFRLPVNLTIKQQYVVAETGDIDALEVSLPSSSRMLVGLVFSERYSGFEEDCEKANDELLKEFGLATWPEYSKFVTPDQDGEPIAWISYQSSPAWWTIILLILGGIFILPIIGVLPLWIAELMIPGFFEAITSIVTLVIMGGFMLLIPKMLKSPEGSK